MVDRLPAVEPPHALTLSRDEAVDFYAMFRFQPVNRHVFLLSFIRAVGPSVFASILSDHHVFNDQHGEPCHRQRSCPAQRLCAPTSPARRYHHRQAAHHC